MWSRSASILGCAVACACTSPSSTPPTGAAPSAAVTDTSTQAVAGRKLYGEVLELMRLDPQDLTRAQRLYPLIAPLCADRSARDAFMRAAHATTEGPSLTGGAERLYALDILEYIAVVCSAEDPARARDFVAAARAVFTDEARLPLVAARILAADGQLDAAVIEAKAARDAGSIGAIALLATIQAAAARAKTVGSPPGLLDEALATVSIEPDGAWRLIDLMAILQTRAQLLTERAVWEDGAARAETATVARSVYERLGAPPFIEPTRQRALDLLCFDAAELGTDDGALDACARAAVDHGNLGGAFLAGIGLDPTRFDLDRVKAIQGVEARVAAMPAGATVLLIARGDESELAAWTRPAAAMLTRVMDRRPKLIVVDRTHGARAGALVDRLVKLAEAQPTLRIDAERDPLAVGCVAALVAGRTRPTGCPLTADAVAQLSKASEFGLAVLVGRDLDAEIDDLELYSLPEVLLSIRQPATDKQVDAHLKSVSDVWLLSRSAATRAGSQPPKPRGR